MTKKFLLLSLILSFIFCLSFSISAQNPQIASVVHTQHKINSTVLGEERTVLVRVPPNYAQTDEKFPVVYMLDAHAPQNAMMAGIIEQQVWGGVMPEMILVGIQNTQRVRDMTPTKTERAGSGGGEKFLEFIEKEVIPMVEKNYRTQPFRIFAGHSLAGMTVVNSFVSRPDLFNAYIAASPFLHWDNNYVVKRAEEAFKQNKDWKKTMFIALGDEPQYTNGFNSFQDLLSRAKPKNFNYEFQLYKDENHGSIVLRAYYAGLRKVFDGWTPPQTGNITDLENHYKRLSDRFGYKIQIPENLLNQIGYQFLNQNRNDEAIAAFRKNIENYPNSANVYDSLGEALEKTGQIKQAKENYEKAYNLAAKQGDTQLAQIFKTNLDRVSEKLK
ncbi:MAG TPA: alpha/beta hydrolase-fold protein [Pyrinomonadaceae bacterium]|nr:alpha/beta hydrolase-fold protein [Pyrinomonadaceae bacterium]